MDWNNVNAQCESEAKWNDFRAFTHEFMCAYVPKKDGQKQETRRELQTNQQGEKVEEEVEWDDGVRVATAFGAGVNLVGVNTHLLHKGKGDGNNKSQVCIAAGVFEKNGACGWTRKPKTATRAVPLVNPASSSQMEAKRKRRKKPGEVDEDERVSRRSGRGLISST